MFFLQLSGVPGSGKSSLAGAVTDRLDAVIVDHDVVKSALLRAGVGWDLAGKAGYEADYTLAAFYLTQGKNVIFDSPCVYAEQLERSQRIARENGSEYKYVLCELDDVVEIDRRLKSRAPVPSQIPAVDSDRTDETVFRRWMGEAKLPAVPYLTVNTANPLNTYIETVISYLKGLSS